MAPSRSQPQAKAGGGGGGGGTAYTAVFVLVLSIFLFLQTQEPYTKFVAKARTQEWATLDGVSLFRRKLVQPTSENEDENNEEESPSSSSNSEEDEKVSEGEKAGSKAESKHEDDEDEEEEEEKGGGGKDDDAQTNDEMAKAKEELLILERAVAAKLEEERLNLELVNTKNGVVIPDEDTRGESLAKAQQLLQENIATELALVMQSWEEDFQRIRTNPQNEEEVKLQEWEERWEKRELEHMLEVAKKKMGYVTLTGRKATEFSIAETQDKASPKALNRVNKVSNKQKMLDKPKKVVKLATDGDEEAVSDFGVDAVVPVRINNLPQLFKNPLKADPDAMEELLQVLKSLENNAMQWTDTSKKNVIVLGEKVYIGRDFKVYKWAFELVGFNIKLSSSTSGKMSTKHVVNGDWSVLLCLALNTEHCFTSSHLGQTKRYQRINRVQGLRRVLWSKDSFCNTVSSSARGSPVFSRYIFDCWIFPAEYPQALEYAQKHPNLQYIVKPLSMGGGMGISVVDGEKGLHKVRRHTQIVQSYLKNPMLIKGKKWDLRTYVLVTSVLPLRAYVYSRGLVRFASSLYDATAKGGGKKTQFLTNTSINKHYVKKGNVTDITWDFESLRRHLDGIQPGTYHKMLGRMQAAISIVLLSAERSWRKYFDGLGGEMCGNCYQLMGVDLIVDDELQPRVIEVNGQPSMQLTKTEEDHYTTTKKNMIRDLVALVYNEDRVSQELVNDLSSFDRDIVTQLSTRDHEYLLEYSREKMSLGGWLPVYPSLRNHRLQDEFFRFQRNPPVEESRVMLHNLLGALEQKLFDEGGPKARAPKKLDSDEGLELDDVEVVETEDFISGDN